MLSHAPESSVTINTSREATYPGGKPFTTWPGAAWHPPDFPQPGKGTPFEAFLGRLRMPFEAFLETLEMPFETHFKRLQMPFETLLEGLPMPFEALPETLRKRL